MATKRGSQQHHEDREKALDEDSTDHTLDSAGLPVYDDEQVRKIRRKIDFRVLPMLTFLYLASFVDRSNIGNASVAGMTEGLGLTGKQFNICLTVSIAECFHTPQGRTDLTHSYSSSHMYCSRYRATSYSST